MSVSRTRRGISLRTRLSVILLLMIAWDAIGIVAEMTFGGPLFKASGDKISGVIGAHGAFGGALAVPLVLYVYALIRGPLRYRGLVWVGVLEQGVAIFFTLYHVGVSQMKVEAMIVPLLVSVVLVILLLSNVPASEPST